MKKIIITSVIVGLVLCLGIATLILGLVPVGMNDKVNVPDEVYIYCPQVYNTPSKRREYRNRDGQEDISKINKIYDTFIDSFSQKALAALFKGELNEGTEAGYTGAKRDTISKNFKTEGKITIVFRYKDAQVLKYENKKQEYNYLYFEIDATNERSEVIMGVSEDITSDEGDYPNENISYNYYYKAKANFSNLYKYVAGLVA